MSRKQNIKEGTLGWRINEQRKAMNMTQDILADAVGFPRQRIGEWERNEATPDIESLKKLCEIFNCECGYLLGEHEGKTKAATDIHDKTGLSYSAIDALERMAKENQWFALHGLNALLEEPACYALDLIGQYLFNPDTKTVLPNKDTVPTKSIVMIAIQRDLDRVESDQIIKSPGAYHAEAEGKEMEV